MNWSLQNTFCWSVWLSTGHLRGTFGLDRRLCRWVPALPASSSDYRYHTDKYEHQPHHIQRADHIPESQILGDPKVSGALLAWAMTCASGQKIHDTTPTSSLSSICEWRLVMFRSGERLI